MAVYDEVKKALQDIMAPQLAEIRGEMRTGFAELRSSVRKVITCILTWFESSRFFDARFRAVEVLERVARLEERLGAAKPAPAG